jgi:hypothetical protein
LSGCVFLAPAHDLISDRILQEVIQLLSGFREIMRYSYETMDTDKIQQRWCCGDEPWLFRERWEKLFEDFCDVKPEKFDPSRVWSLNYHKLFLRADQRV